MKKSFRYFIPIALAVFTALAVWDATADARAVRRYISEHYNDREVIYTTYAPHEVAPDRAGTVVVQIVKSKSQGNHGTTPQGYYIAYNARVKRGKTVTSYLIYNPNTNADDDVVAVVDNGKIR